MRSRIAGGAVRPTSRRPMRWPLALGLGALAWLLWWTGPLVELAGRTPLASPGARWAAIALLLALWGIVASARRLRRAGRDKALFDGFKTGADEPAPGAAEVALTARRFDAALQRLRRRSRSVSHLAWLRGGAFVYELPWYILIGAPGSGKTTTLAHSGLRFPLATEQGPKSLRGIAGTRHCEWWFAEEAVLIDTAGRYTTQDSWREADQTAWRGFLALLAQHRPRQPINGTILVLSVPDLLQPAADARRALAHEMRARLHELRDGLNVHFPVYLMVTKCDLLAGFAEFFADFDADQRAQIWGLTLPRSDDATPVPLAQIDTELLALEKTLNERMIERLAHESELERREAIFAFPQQWRVMREALAEMLEATFDAGAGTPARLRGVYFTSATQEGSPIDRALAGLARSLGLAHQVLPPARPSGKAFFVRRLLSDLVVGEAALAGTDPRWEKRQRWLRRAVLGATGLAVPGLLAWGWLAHLAHDAGLAELRSGIEALHAPLAQARAAGPTDVAGLVPLLGALHGLAGDADDAGDAAEGWPSRGALSALDPTRTVREVARDVYHHALRDALVRPLAARLEQRLQAGSPSAAALQYEALKAYLMLFGGRQFDAMPLRAYLLAESSGAAALAGAQAPLADAATLQALAGHLDRLLATGEVGAPSRANPVLVHRVRQEVAAVPLAERAWQRIAMTDAATTAADSTNLAAAHPGATRLLARAQGGSLAEPVPAAMRRAWHGAALRARALDVLGQLESEAAWVLGPAAGAADAAHAGTHEPAALVEQIERRHAAVVRQHWQALVEDLQLVPPGSLAAAAEQARALARPDSPLIAVLAAILAEAPGEAESFAALRAWALGPNADRQPVHAAAGRLATQIDAVNDALARSADAPAMDAIDELDAVAERTPEPVRRVLRALAQHSAAWAWTALREPLGRRVARELGPPCARTVDARYPFERGAAQQATRDDVVQLVGAGGALDVFVQRHLAGLVEPGSRPWRARMAADGTRPAAAELQAAGARALAIRQTLFDATGRAIGVDLELRLLDIDAGLAQVEIDVDGRALRLARDARQATLHWPGAGPGKVTLSAGRGASFAFDGPWALLHLLDRVRVEAGASATRAVLVFDIEGRRARVEARSARGVLPIVRAELEEFRCPRRL